MSVAVALRVVDTVSPALLIVVTLFVAVFVAVLARLSLHDLRSRPSDVMVERRRSHGSAAVQPPVAATVSGSLAPTRDGPDIEIFTPRDGDVLAGKDRRKFRPPAPYLAAEIASLKPGEMALFGLTPASPIDGVVAVDMSREERH